MGDEPSIAPEAPQPTESTAPVDAPVAEGTTGASDDGPFAAIYAAVPQGLEAVRAAARDMEAKISRSSREASDFRKQWEPYGDLGLHEYEPDALQEALLLDQLFREPESVIDRVDVEAFRPMLEKVAQALGITTEQAQAQIENANDSSDLDPRVAKAIEFVEKQEQAQAEAEREAQLREAVEKADAEFQEALDAIVGEDDDLFGLEVTEGDQKFKPAEDLLTAHAAVLIDRGIPTQDAVQVAHKVVTGLRNAIEEKLVGRKLEQPKPAVREGGASTAPPKIDVGDDPMAAFDAADAQLDARLRGAA